MSTQIQRRKGTTAQHSTFTGANAELTVDTTKKTVVVHDGATAGGVPLLREDLSNLPAGTIDNADVSASAAISGTKISPNFGSQAVTTTGTSTAASFSPTSSTVPTNGVYLPAANSVALATNGTQRLLIDSSGVVSTTGTLKSGNGVLQLDNASQYKYVDFMHSGVRQGHISWDNTNNWMFIQANASNSQLLFSTNNSEKMRITSDGKVGVGTSSPGQTLGVTTASNDDGIILTNSSVNGGRIRIASTGTGGREYHINSTANGSGAGGGKFVIRDNTASDAARLTIDSSGNVGIGTTSPSEFVELYKASGSCNLRVTSGSSSGNLAQNGTDTYLTNGANGPIQFWANGSERARIDSSGRLLVGTSSAAQYNHFSDGIRIQLAGTNSATSSFQAAAFEASTSGPLCIFSKSRGSTVGTNTVVAANDNLGSIFFIGADGTNWIRGASIAAQVDGTPGQTAGTFVNGQQYRILTTGTTDFTLIGAANSTPGTIFTATGAGTGTGTAILTSGDMPGRLVFSTTAGGASSPTERMRITQNGSLRIGQASTDTPGLGNTTVGIGMEPSNGALFLSRGDGSSLFVNRNSDGACSGFYRSGTLVGTISVTTTATAYNTSSDYRLKENVVPLTGAADRVNQLQVHRFNFIADPTTTVDGFLAHEAQAVVPECVTGTKDEVDDEGNPVYQGIDQSKLVPLLTAALQEALAKIETLEARLTAAGI